MYFIWLLLIGLVAYALLSKRGKPLGEWAKSAEDPDEVLKKRFVNGEISEEEYKKMWKTIHEEGGMVQ